MAGKRPLVSTLFLWVTLAALYSAVIGPAAVPRSLPPLPRLALRPFLLALSVQRLGTEPCRALIADAEAASAATRERDGEIAQQPSVSLLPPASSAALLPARRECCGGEAKGKEQRVRAGGA